MTPGTRFFPASSASGRWFEHGHHVPPNNLNSHNSNADISAPKAPRASRRRRGGTMAGEDRVGAEVRCRPGAAVQTDAVRDRLSSVRIELGNGGGGCEAFAGDQ